MIKSRFAPSPTGFMHVGSARAALLPYLFCQKNNGIFILRIDDTDAERSKFEYETDIKHNLQWLQIDYSHTFKQSDNVHEYNRIFDLLKNKHVIYECFETPEELEDIKNRKRLQRKAPIITREDCKAANNGSGYWRFELNGHCFELHDLIQGYFKFGRDWSDPVIRKPDGSYTYMFASVIDDINHKITHIIRGEEHITNTILQQELGNAICKLHDKPKWGINFAHFSLFLDSDGHKISKRDLCTGLSDLRRDIEPMALWSIMSSLGTNQNQIFSLDKKDYIINFALDNFSKSKQKFSCDLITKTSSKIFKLRHCPHDIDRNLWNLFIDNADSMTDIKCIIEHFYNFQKEKSELYVLLKNATNIDDLSKKFNLNKREMYIQIYQKILGKTFGPKLEDLVRFL
jgi:glutamyl-tRNA synthetase